MSDIRVSDVFGTQRNEPKNYVEREYVDDQFLKNLRRDKHVVIHGGSKQGKTCLRSHCLEDDEMAEIICQFDTSLVNLQEQILKKVGYRTEVLNKETQSGHNKLKAKLTSKIPGIGGGGVEGEMQEGYKDETQTKPLELDPSDINDIVEAINKTDFDKYIVLEDFHYLPIDVQKNFAGRLKAIHQQTDITFIIVGVWLEENRLILYSGDLGGRVVSVDADSWERGELKGVIEKGERLLNIKFDEQFKSELVSKCYESVYVLQEICLRVCWNNDITSKQPNTTEVSPTKSVDELIDDVMSEQDATYRGFLREFSSGFRKTDYELYKWILYSLITTDIDELKSGKHMRDILEEIEHSHPEVDNVNQGHLTQSLGRVVPLQNDKNIEPIILDYNSDARRLDIVDKRFLIWLDNRSMDTLMEFIDIEQ
ncbi:hypothetical protein ACH9L7_14890 [Haloferax sp. S1W]|uniref:hypothetical protein n=1 Tax=Haloferax sp. S1W TaxID=3377110 RepID=UPI0037C9BA9D